MKTTGYLDVIQNMGWFDRAARFVLGFVLIGAVMLTMEEGQDTAVYAYWLIFSIYPLMTAILGWDPLYHLFHARSCQLTGRNQCGTFPFEVEAALGKKMECDNGYDCSISGNQHAHSSHR